MRAVLTAACVLATGFVSAADKPKKERPATTMRPITDPPFPSPTPTEPKLVVAKPVGVWFKDVRLENLACRVTLAIDEDRLKVECEMTDNTDRLTMRLDADYAINKEGSLFGVIDTFEMDLPQMPEFADSTKLSGQPYSFRFRADDASLSLKEFKGLGIGWASDAPPESLKVVVAHLCGRYSKVDPAKPPPPLKRSEADIKRSEEKEKAERERLRHLAPSALGVETPKPKPTEDEVLAAGHAFRQLWDAFSPFSIESKPAGGVPYPSPYYLKHPPVYFPPDPALPLQRERDAMLDPAGEIRRGDPDRPMLPPVPLPNAPATSDPTGDVEVTPLPSPGTRPDPLSSRGGRTRPNCDLLPLPAIPVPPKVSASPVGGEKSECEPPSDAAVLRIFRERQWPNISEVNPDDLTIVKNLVVDRLDAPRFFGPVGMAQVRRLKWECGVYCSNLKTNAYPYPLDIRKPKVEVIYIDKTILQACPHEGVDDGLRRIGESYKK